jgi:hypothetical protein
MVGHSTLTNYASSGGWRLPEVMQNFTSMFSNINATSDGRLDVAAPFIVEPIQCLYATSGVYSPAKRIIFYVLCLLSLRFRRKNWISGVCMGIVMSYSSIAALHAIILASIRKTLITANIEMVTISNTGDISIPIWPMIWDEDCDAVLAITGTAFLIMAPLAIWSDTVQQILQNHPPLDTHARKKRRVLIGWFFLLLIGLISAWVNEVFVDMYSAEQFKFCSAGGERPGIGSSSSLNLYSRQIAGKSLNDTLWEIFSIPAISQGQIPTCIYPCFSAPGHRQDGDIKAIVSKGAWLAPSDYSNASAGWALMLTSIVLIVISFAAILTIFVLERKGHLNYGRGGRIKHLRDNGDDTNSDENDGSGLPRGSFPWSVDYGAKGLALASFIIFIVWIEYIMGPFPTTEVVSDIGQWGDIITAILVLVFAAYENWDEFTKACQHTKESTVTEWRRLSQFIRRIFVKIPILRTNFLAFYLCSNTNEEFYQAHPYTAHDI